MSLMNLASTDLEQTINSLSSTSVTIGSIALIVLVLLALFIVPRFAKAKLPLFVLIVAVVLGTTGIISGSTVYLNLKSATGGPVHWHADFEVWACGNELELRDPQGFLSNKIGTPTLHEHNDKRVHLEGVPISLPHDASLGKFMTAVGGEISKNSLVLPMNADKLYENATDDEDGDGVGAPTPELVQPFIKSGDDGTFGKFISGQYCGEQKAEVQVFAFNYNDTDKTYTQRKLEDPATYAIGKHEQVPAGDCLIVEFGPKTDRTDKLCRQYGIHDVTKCEAFGVPAKDRHICDSREVR